MKKKKGNVKTIETTSVFEEGESFAFSNGQTIYIGRQDLDFFLKLRDLPPFVVIEMMQLSDDDLRNHLTQKLKKTVEKLISYFSQKWQERIEGDPWDFNDVDMNEAAFGLRMTAEQIIKKLKSRKKFPIEQMNKLIQWFESGRDVTTFDDEIT